MRNPHSTNIGEPRASVALRLQGLESVRGLAAIYVAIYHANQLFFQKRVLVFRFGPEAVIIFFLLSGFVIVRSNIGTLGPIAPRKYLIKRIRRIYPLYLFALGLTLLVRAIVAGTASPIGWGSLIGNLLMLQDLRGKPGLWVETYSNPVFWSISYEWWFYLIFLSISLVSIKPSVQRWLAFTTSAVGTAGYVFIPNQACTFAMYFAIWWAGAEMAREAYSRGTIGRGQVTMLLFIAMLAIVWCVPIFIARRTGAKLEIGEYPILEVRHITAAILFCSVSLLWNRYGWIGFHHAFGWAAFLAPVSYGIYLVHWPLMVAAASLFPHSATAALVTSLIATGVLAWLLERVLQPAVNRWTDPLLGRSATPSRPTSNPTRLPGDLGPPTAPF